jgi:hypothetical protein
MVRHRERDEKEGRAWDVQFDARLESNLSEAQRKLVTWKRIALTTTLAFFLDCAAIVPFLYGHSLHDYWDQLGKYLVMLAMVLLIVWLFSCGNTFIFWYSIRGTKRIKQM